jgi:class 3 adenylate cyclase/tetratricopeptide (TPR) repeat protein
VAIDQSDLRRWLATLGLDAYADALARHEVDLRALRHLSDEDLREIGLPLGPRRVVQTAIAQQFPRPVETAGSERRQLTVMFCDLVDSTALTARLGPEEMRDLIQDYFSTCSRIVEAGGGYIARLVGDGILAYFGYPSAREDAAECATRAGLRIVRSLPQEWKRHGPPPAVRIGIATGVTVVSDMVGGGFSELHTVVGQAPNLASRIQSVATPGAVLVSQETRRLAGDFFVWSDEGSHSLKGIEEPVRLWRVLGESHPAARFDVRPVATACIGREAELDRLNQAWASAQRDGCQIVTIVGEAGIGKSRLLRAAAEAIGASGAEVIWQCSPSQGASPLHPVVNWIRRDAGLGQDEHEGRQLLEAWLGDGAGPHDLAVLAELAGIPQPGHPARAHLPPDRKRELMCQIVARLLHRRGGDAGCLLMVEDVHWIDGTTRDFLQSLFDGMRSNALLVVVTTRPEPDSRWQAVGADQEIQLGPLGTEDARRLVHCAFGERNAPASIVDDILAKTDGVPLFIEELAAAVLDSGMLKERDGHWVLDGPAPMLDIPSTLHDSLLARLDRLSDVREVARVASAIGREFSFSLLAHVMDISPARLVEALDRLVQAQLLFQRGTLNEADFVFKHALVQQAAYESQLRRDRQELHARIVQAIEAHQPDLARREPGFMAHQCQQAGWFDREVDYLMEAGRASTRLVAIPQALASFERAAEIISTLEPSSLNTRRHIDTILGMMEVGRFAILPRRLQVLSERARLLARTDGSFDVNTLATILFQDGRTKVYTTRYAEARDIFREIVQIGAAQGAPAIERRPASAFAMGLCCQGLFEEALAYLNEDNIGHYKEAGSFIDYIAGLGWIGYARCQMAGDVGLRWGDQSVQEAAAHHSSIYLAGAHVWRSHALMAVRRFDDAIEDASACVRLGESDAIPYLGWHGLVFLALCQCRNGNPDAAERSLAAARELLAKVDGCWSLLDYLPAIEAEIALARRRFDDVVRLANQCLGIAIPVQGHFAAGMALRAKALAALHSGELMDEAYAWFDQAMQRHRTGGAWAEYAFSAQLWSRALLEHDKAGAASKWLDTAGSVAARHGFHLARCEFAAGTIS